MDKTRPPVGGVPYCSRGSLETLSIYNVDQIRQFLQTQLGGSAYATKFPTFMKSLPSILLNCDASKVIYTIRVHNYFVSHQLIFFCRAIQGAKQDICTQALSGLHEQVHNNDSRITDSNRVCFCLEAIEQNYMKCFLLHLLRFDRGIESLILIHDGIWIRPLPPLTAISNAAEAAAALIRLPGMRVKITVLRTAHEQLLRELRTVAGSDSNAGIRELQLLTCRYLREEEEAIARQGPRHDPIIKRVLGEHKGRPPSKRIKALPPVDIHNALLST